MEESENSLLREGENAMIDRLADEMGHFARLAEKRIKGGGYSKKQRESYARAEWRMAHRVADAMIDKMHLEDKVTVVDSADDIPELYPDGKASGTAARKRNAKGWFDPKTGMIYVILGNHGSSKDVAQTILHECVAHYGLRKLFGKHFDTFLDEVYKNADVKVRKRIAELATQKNWDFRTATEEYIASLAESDEFRYMVMGGERSSNNILRDLLSVIKEAFTRMLDKLGLGEYTGPEISDNELMYLLWRSYKNLSDPGYYNSIFGVAEDIAMQSDLKVGNYTPQEKQQHDMSKAVEISYSGVASTFGDSFSDDMKDRILDTYNRMKERFGEGIVC